MSVEDRLRLVVVKSLGVNPERVTAETRIMDDLGADSLDMIEMAMATEEEFGIEISDEAWEKAETFADMLALIPAKS